MIVETKENPDIREFNLEAMEGLGAHSDGSGGGIFQLAFEMRKLRELRERMALLDAFVRRYQLTLARLSWSLEATTLHPWRKEGEEGDLAATVPEVRLRPYAYNGRRGVVADDVAGVWPVGTKWRRVMPPWGSDTERDWAAEVDGVVIRIKAAEVLAKPKPVDRFAPCGPIRIGGRK